MRHVGVARRRYAAPTKHIAVRGVKARTDDHEVWGKFVRDGQDTLLEGMQIVGIAHTRARPGDIDRGPKGIRAADLVIVAERRAGIKGAVLVAMQRYVQHVAVVPKDALRAIAVVHIPVENHDAASRVIQKRACRDGDVVVQTKALAPVRLRMMAGWSDNGKAVLNTA